MGVVYKLKKEIVDFIINEKKSNPALGCRNLVSLIEAKFQTNISKSSINEVIKSAQLSSSIGRKPLGVKPPPKFKIPEEKKTQLFRADLGKIETSPQPPGESSALSQTASKVGLNKTRIKSEGQGVVPSALAPSTEEEAVLKSSFDQGVLCDSAGCFFLKAAQWELAHRSILGKMISKYVVPELINDADALSEVLLFLPMFGVSRLEDISTYKNSGLWAMNGLTESIGQDKFLRLVNGIQDKKSFSMRLSNEIPQIFFEAVYIKIILEDQTALVLDAQYRNLWSIQNSPVYYSSPIEKSIERLTSKIIMNSQNIIIQNINYDNGFTESVCQLIAAFENMQGKRISHVAILDENGEEISKFTSSPFKRRFFILGSEIKVSDDLKKGLHSQSFLNPLMGETLEFCEKSFPVEKNSILTEDILLRAIFVKKSDSKDDAWGMILTNIPESSQSSQEVMSEYLKEWPYFLKKSHGEGWENVDKDFFRDTKISFSFYKNCLAEQGKAFLSTDSQEMPDFWNNMGVILSGFNKYCQRHFFHKAYAKLDISTIKERFYQLAGYLKKDSGYLEVSLILPEGYAYRHDLEGAIRKLNESQIRDYSGQRLWMKIKS